MAAQLIIRNILEQSVVSVTISDMNPADWELGMFWDENDIEDFVKEWSFPETITADSTIAEAMKDTSESVGTHIEIEDVRKMFEETGLMPSLGSLVTPYERYLLTGNDEKIFSPDDIMNEIKKHRDSVQESIGLDISIFYELLEECLNDVAPAFDELNPAELLNNAGAYTSTAVGTPLILGTAALSLAMLVVAVLITKRFFPCLGMYGISLTLAGIVPMVTGAALPVLLSEETALRYNTVNYITREFNMEFRQTFFTIGAIFATVGVVLIISSVIVSMFLKKNAQAPQTTA